MHDIKNDSAMRSIVGVGIFVSCVMLAGSAYFNATFAYRLGQNPIDGTVYAIMGVGADVFLVGAPFYFISALKAREWVGGLCTLLTWAVLIVVSANAAIGHIAGSRINAMSSKLAAATSYQDIRAELKRLNERLGWLPKPADSQDSLRAKIKAQQSQLLWQQTQECANQWNTPQKQFCAKLTELTSALTNTIEYDKTVARISELQAKSDAAASNNVVVVADGVDAQATFYSKMFGMEVTTISGIISGLFASVILMLSSMGFYMAMAPKRAATRARAQQAAETPEPDTPIALVEAEPARALIDITPAKPQAMLAPARELSQDAKDLLRAIGIPDKPCDKREKDGRDVVGWRFYTWLVCSGYTGDFAANQIDTFYAAFAMADNREPSVERIYKNELAAIGQKYVLKATREKLDGQRGAVWTIRAVSLARLAEVLRKRGIIGTGDAAAAEVVDVQPEPEPPNASYQSPEGAKQQPSNNVFAFFKRPPAA